MDDIQRNIKLVDDQLAKLSELKNEALAKEDFQAASIHKDEITNLHKQRDQLSRELRKEAASMIANEIESLAQGVLPPKNAPTTEGTPDPYVQVPKKPLPVPPKKKVSEVEPAQALSMNDLDKQIEDILQMIAVSVVPQQSTSRRESSTEPLPDSSTIDIEQATNFEELLTCLDVAWRDLDILSQRRTKLEHQVTALMSFLEDMDQQLQKVDTTACS